MGLIKERNLFSHAASKYGFPCKLQKSRRDALKLYTVLTVAMILFSRVYWSRQCSKRLILHQVVDGYETENVDEVVYKHRKGMHA